MDTKSKVERKLVTIKEVSVYLSKSVGSIYQMVARRQIPYVKMYGSLRFNIQEIDEWIKSHSIGCVAG